MATSRSRRMLMMTPFAFGVGATFPSCRRKMVPRGDPSAARWRSIVGLDDASFRLPPPSGWSITNRRPTGGAYDVATGCIGERPVSVCWNETGRDLVARHRVELLAASRVYALLGVAQHDVCVGVFRNKYLYHLPRSNLVSARLQVGNEQTPEPGYPNVESAVAAASAEVLMHLFPSERRTLQERVAAQHEARIAVSGNAPVDVEAGAALGRTVGAAVIAHRRDDGADDDWDSDMEVGPGGWTPTASRLPHGMRWGNVRPWVMDRAARFRAPPPPDPSSPEFKRALREVRRLSDRRTEEQARIAALWADGTGSYTPAGRWNKIAADLVLREGLDEVRAARCFALLNLALMDAGIACFDTKYHYSLVRPWQVDTSIETPVGTPNFPSYTSAHACLSGAGAGLLAELFPADRRFLLGKAEEAAVSRIYGGLHYRFDAETGLAQGHAIARQVWQRLGQEDRA